MITCALAAAGVLFIGSQAMAQANSPQLSGTYGFTGTYTCIGSPAAIPPNLVLTTPPVIFSDAVQGTITFNGNGTGTVSGSSMGVEIGSPSFGFSSTYGLSFTYTINGDGTWTSKASTPVTGTGTGGALAGVPFTINNFPNFTGQISRNGSTLTAATLTPSVETVTFGGSPPLNRICQRTHVLLKLPNNL
jgi:hypothetical protein